MIIVPPMIEYIKSVFIEHIPKLSKPITFSAIANNAKNELKTTTNRVLLYESSY